VPAQRLWNLTCRLERKDFFGFWAETLAPFLRLVNERVAHFSIGFFLGPTYDRTIVKQGNREHHYFVRTAKLFAAEEQ
jgi:hypothetical protein